MKKKFSISLSYKEKIDLLTLQDKGILLDAIMKYNSGEQLPEMTQGAALVFSFMQPDFDNERIISEKRRVAGRKGGAPKGNTNAARILNNAV